MDERLTRLLLRLSSALEYSTYETFRLEMRMTIKDMLEEIADDAKSS